MKRLMTLCALILALAVLCVGCGQRDVFDPQAFFWALRNLHCKRVYVKCPFADVIEEVLSRADSFQWRNGLH